MTVHRNLWLTQLIFPDGLADSSDEEIIIVELNNDKGRGPQEEAGRLEVNREGEVDVRWSPGRVIKNHAEANGEEKDGGDTSRSGLVTNLLGRQERDNLPLVVR